MAQPSKSKSKSKENHGTQHRASPKRTSTRVPLAPRNSDDSDTSARSGSASGRIARLEAELAKAKRQRDRANEALRAERSQPSRDTHADATAETIPRPSNASKVKMSELQDMLDIDNLTWNAIHTCTRDALSSARPDYARVWKAQKPDKFAKAYNAIEEEFPVLRRCEGQWGIDRIAKQTWGNRKSYRSCIGNSLTYHGRRAAARRNRAPQSGRPTRVRSRSSTPPQSVQSLRSSPVAGPSQPRPRRLSEPRTSPNDDDDGLMDCEDEDRLQDGGEDDEDPEPSHKGKKRAAAQNTDVRKRSRQ